MVDGAVQVIGEHLIQWTHSRIHNYITSANIQIGPDLKHYIYAQFQTLFKKHPQIINIATGETSEDITPFIIQVSYLHCNQRLFLLLNLLR